MQPWFGSGPSGDPELGSRGSPAAASLRLQGFFVEEAKGTGGQVRGLITCFQTSDGFEEAGSFARRRHNKGAVENRICEWGWVDVTLPKRSGWIPPISGGGKFRSERVDAQNEAHFCGTCDPSGDVPRSWRTRPVVKKSVDHYQIN